MTLRLEGRRSNRSAVGARIEVEVEQGRQRRRIYATVSTGGSFGSQTLQQELGLGRADAIVSVKIGWPATGEVETLEGLPLDSIVHVVEGKGGFTLVERRPYRLGAAARAESKNRSEESED